MLHLGMKIWNFKYSTKSFKVPEKVWIKHNGSGSIKVPLNNCDDIYDLTEIITQKLPSKFDEYSIADIYLYKTLDDSSILARNLKLKDHFCW